MRYFYFFEDIWYYIKELPVFNTPIKALVFDMVAINLFLISMIKPAV